MGLFGKSRAKKLEEKAAAQGRKLDRMLASRQSIIDPYSGVKDLSSMLYNPFAGMPVATQGAEMAIEAAGASRAAKLDYLRSVGAGAAAVTQLSLEEQGQIQQASADIERQQRENMIRAAQGEQMLMGARMQEAQRIQEAGILGQTFMFQAQEQRDVADLSRVSAMQQQYGQQAMDIRAANRAMVGQIVGSIAGAGAELGSAAIAASDRKLKKDIKLIGESRSGLNIYEFKYIDSNRFGEGVYQGVMSDEVPNSAVVNSGGYDSVDYSKIDVEFKRVR